MRARLLDWLPVLLLISLVAPAAGQFQRPLQFRGRIVLEDGSPAPAEVVIERVCNATPQAVTRTDPSGAFRFEVADSTEGSVADASYPGSDRQVRARANPGDWADGATSRQALIGCEMRASLAGYRSDSVPLYGYGPYETDIDLGTIVLHQSAEVQGYAVSVTTAQAPQKARQAYEEGLRRVSNGKWDQAETQLRRAVEEYPGYAIAWQALGEVLEEQQRPHEAREAYDKAVAADNGYLNPYMLIAMLAARENDWHDVEAAANKIISLNAFDYPEAYYFQAVARANLGDLAGAERSAREAITHNAQTRYPQIEKIFGQVLAAQGNLAEASEHLKKYLESSPDASDAQTIRNRLAEIDSRIVAQ